MAAGEGQHIEEVNIETLKQSAVKRMLNYVTPTAWKMIQPHASLVASETKSALTDGEKSELDNVEEKDRTNKINELKKNMKVIMASIDYLEQKTMATKKLKPTGSKFTVNLLYKDQKGQVILTDTMPLNLVKDMMSAEMTHIVLVMMASLVTFRLRLDILSAQLNAKALVRLLCLSTAYVHESGEAVCDAFDELKHSERVALTRWLTADGIKERPGYVLREAPELFQNAQANPAVGVLEALKALVRVQEMVQAADAYLLPNFAVSGPVKAYVHLGELAILAREANKGLCNHLTYSGHSRHALLNAGFQCAVEPGTGSRRFDTGAQVLLPAVRAQGPSARWDFTPVVDEPQQPSAALLQALEECFCHDAKRLESWTALVDCVRSHFQSQCLQVSRLQATAKQWYTQLLCTLEQDEDWDVQWTAWHQRLARLLLEVDFIEWLGDGAGTPELLASTFRDAEILTPWLELEGVHIQTLPAPSTVSKCFAYSSNPPVWFRPTDCEVVQLLDFAAWGCLPSTAGLVFLSGLGLDVSFSHPHPISSFKHLSGPLDRLRVLSDLIRGLFHLWTKAVPACIVLPRISCPTVEVIRKLAPHRTQVHCAEVLANFEPEACVLFHF
ncbi:HERC2 [Symbiodinium sp. CCMP2592]|nr:HERC2 [Symbiodinium sp. CCMP2592]